MSNTHSSLPKKMERYLYVLERRLAGLPTSQRITIINEFRDEFADQLGGGSQSLHTNDHRVDQILQRFLPMEEVLEQKLRSRGLTLPEPEKNIAGRLLLIVVGFFIAGIIAISFAAWYYSPIVEFNDETGEVTLFGGKLDMKDLEELESDFFKQLDNMDYTQTSRLNGHNQLKGKRNFNGVDLEEIHIDVQTAALNLSTSTEQNMEWACETLGQTVQQPFNKQGNRILFDLSGDKKSKCNLKLPQGVPVKISATNLRLNSVQLASPLDVLASNGQIHLDPDEQFSFLYQLQIKDGEIDTFANPKGQKADYVIKIELINGYIKKSK